MVTFNMYVLGFLSGWIIFVCESFHVFVSSDTKSLYTRQSFNIVLYGQDCPYPCYYTVSSGGSYIHGEYGDNDNNIGAKIIPLNISHPGSHLVYVRLMNTVAYTKTFVLSVEVHISNQCHHVKFCHNNTFIESLQSIESNKIVKIAILNDEGSDLSKFYFHSGVEPNVYLRNCSTSFVGAIDPDYDNGSWFLNLTSTYLLNPSVQNDWELTVSVPPLEAKSCTVRRNSLIISLVNDLFTSPIKYFGNLSTPTFNDNMLSYCQSPCSKNLLIIYQKSNKYIGITTNNGETVTWHMLQNLKNINITSACVIFDVVLLPDHIIIVTNEAIITVTSDKISMRQKLSVSASITSSFHCPVSINNQVSITFDDNNILKSEYPYTSWEYMANRSQFNNFKIQNTYYDAIRQIRIFTYFNDSDVWILGKHLNNNLAFNPVRAKMDILSGVHWHKYTSYMYLYGSAIIFSRTLGSSLSTIMKLSGDDLVLYMSSCPYSGDILAVTKNDKLYLSNVGVNRFSELQNIHDVSSPRYLRFYAFQQTAHLSKYILNSTVIQRFGIPTRSILKKDRKTQPLMLEVIGKDLVQIIAYGQIDFFGEFDKGKTFMVKSGYGAGVIQNVENYSHDRILFSSAKLRVTERFIDIKNKVSDLYIEQKEDEIFISLIGDTWNNDIIGQCINVLMCTPLLIDVIMNKTTVKVIALYPGRVTRYCTGKISSNNWFIVNLNDYASEIALSWDEVFTVRLVNSSYPSEVGNTLISLESSILSLKTINLSGKILTFKNQRYGIIKSITENTIKITTNFTFLIDETFKSWEVKFHSPDVGLLSEYPRKTHWIISEETCNTYFVNKQLNNITYPFDNIFRYIDTNKYDELTVLLSNTKSTENKFITMFDNREKFNFTHAANSTNHIKQLTVNITHNSNVGGKHTSFSITPHDISLKCEVPSVLYTIFRDCNPLTKLSVKYPNIPSHDYFLNDTLVVDGNEHLTRLPVNYRPPSSYGLSISISPYVYNADPNSFNGTISDSFKHISEDAISLNESWPFKQCAEQAAQSEKCNCTAAQYVSDMVIDSYCRKTVFTLSYSKEFNPELYINEFGQEPSLLNSSYIMTEVNGRKEFEIFQNLGKKLTVSHKNCSYTNCSIRFLGSELFHFRVEVTSNTICQYNTEFLVYVVNAPLSTTLHNILTVWVGLIVILIILIYYVMFSSTRNEQEHIMGMTQERPFIKSLNQESMLM